jgi:hypothetical protein
VRDAFGDRYSAASAPAPDQRLHGRYLVALSPRRHAATDWTWRATATATFRRAAPRVSISQFHISCRIAAVAYCEISRVTIGRADVEELGGTLTIAMALAMAVSHLWSLQSARTLDKHSVACLSSEFWVSSLWSILPVPAPRSSSRSSSTEPGYNEWYGLESHVEEPLRGAGGSSFKGGESKVDYKLGFEGAVGKRKVDTVEKTS